MRPIWKFLLALPAVVAGGCTPADLVNSLEPSDHYRLVADLAYADAARQRLVVEITLKDPDFFTRDFDPATLEYAPTDLKLEPFNCSPEGVTGTLKK